MAIILASASPRRRELLEKIGIRDFLVIPPEGEEVADRKLPPDAFACSLAAHKAKEIASQANPEDVIIAADTIVVLDGKILGKPSSRKDGIEMLHMLSGRAHTVYTGVAVLCGAQLLNESEETRVFFRSLTDREIEAYWDTGEPADKAGSYGAQGIGALLISRIEGDFFNVMGLPVSRLGQMLRRVGVNIL